MSLFRASAVTLLLSLALYFGFTAYVGLYLGGRPAGWHEGKFLVLPFYPVAWMSAAAAVTSFLLSMAAAKTSISRLGSVAWKQVLVLASSALATILFLFCSVVPVGLGIAYEIADIRRATWQNQQ